jgi:hypothetical protein
VIRLNELKITEDVGILEVDLCVSNGICGIEQNLTLSVELNSVGGLVDSVGGFDQRQVGQSLGLHSDVLLVHVLDVVYIVQRPNVHRLHAQIKYSLSQHLSINYFLYNKYHIHLFYSNSTPKNHDTNKSLTN